MKNRFDIVLMPGDGIGKEISDRSLELVKLVAEKFNIELVGTEVEAGAELYKRTGDGFPEENFLRASEADAIYLGAMGLPNIRYPDGTEVGPQHDLRKRLGLYAGVRPCITMPGLELPLADKRGKNLDFVIVRESTEGIFAYPRGHELDTEERAHNLMMITKSTSEKLFEYSFNLSRRRKLAGGKGKVTCIDKANVLSSMFFFREQFDRVKEKHQDILADYMYVDAAALNMVRRPWDFDVCPTENFSGDILSDLAAALMGGMGMAPSAEIGDRNAVFQPCHGTAPDIVGTGKANPTGMILSGGMMLDYLGVKFDNPDAVKAGEFLTQSVKNAYSSGELTPYELGGDSGTDEIFRAVINEVEKGYVEE